MSYSSIVVLTGAGISAESGLKTFRASDGLWENHAIEEVATPQGFARNPDLVHRFYNARRRQLALVEPNNAHRALARFEDRFPGDFLLVTQNVDDLHERAGSENLIHIHGELLKIRCQACGQVFSWYHDLSVEMPCACCHVAGNLRPHIVWFGEMPLQMEMIYRALSTCDLFVSIGTSGNVYPAAGFFQAAVAARTVELNLEPSKQGTQFDEQHYGPASVLVEHFFKHQLSLSGF